MKSIKKSSNRYLKPLIQAPIVLLIFMLNTVYTSALAVPSDADFDENRLQIVITPDHFPIIWKDAQKYGVDFTLAPGEFETLTECVETIVIGTPPYHTVQTVYHCPNAAMAAGAVRYKVYNVPGHGNVHVYYDNNGEIVGTAADFDGDGIGDESDDDIDNDGIDDYYDAFPFDPDRMTDIVAGPSAQFAVSPSGAGTYSISLPVPPGIGGIAPKLSLDYNSQAGNGLLGLGWTLGGLSVIHRCPTTIATDGSSDGVDFDDNDQFCLDGKRLLLVSGSHTGSGEYRTEIDSIQKIESFGSPLNLTTYGSSHFVVHVPSGEVMEFGNTEDSWIKAQGKAKAYIWALNKVTDSSGNTMTFSYTKDTNNSTYRPSRIDYAYANGQYNAYVIFEYEDRPDTQPGYWVGSTTLQPKRLKSVKTYADGSLVKEYRLFYKTSDSTGRSLFNRFLECSHVSGVRCLKPLDFTWQQTGTDPDQDESYASNRNGEVSFGGAHWILDTDGDGIDELIYNKEGQPYYRKVNDSWGAPFGSKQYSADDPYRQWTVDINGDGLLDFAYKAVEVPHEYWVMVNSGNGTSQSDSKWGEGYSVALDGRSWPVDMNADGRTDLVYASLTSVYARDYRALISQPSSEAVDTAVGSRNYDVGLDYQHFTIDVNGDGATDLVYNEAGLWNYKVLINTQNNSFDEDDWTSRTFQANYGFSHWPMDVNGDGTIDLVYNSNTSNGTYRVLINKGDRTADDQELIVAGIGHAADFYGKHWVLDTNADGIMDLVYVKDNTYQYYSIESRADGNRELRLWKTRDNNNIGYGGTHWAADVNGDGLGDLVYNIENSHDYRVLKNRQKYELITGINDSFDNTTEIDYAPVSSSGGVYTKTENAYGQYPNNLMSASAMQVVKEVRQPNGIGGINTTRYQYKDLRVNREGRGILGFREVETESVESKIVKTTIYNQAFPKTGMPARALQYYRRSNGSLVLLTDTTTNYGTRSTVGSAQLVYPQSTVEKSYHFDSASESSSLLATTTTTNTINNDYGNVENVTVDIVNNVESDAYRVVTVNTYWNDVSQWYIGRLTGATVTKSHNSATDSNSITKTTFGYDPNTGLLEQETIEPDRAEPYKMITVYEHDSNGNITKSTVCATDFGNCGVEGQYGPAALPYRIIETLYDSRGQFPLSTTNGLDQTETYVYERKFGNLKNQTGPNQLTTSYVYDVFGRQTQEFRADGTRTTTYRNWCGSCPSNVFGTEVVYNVVTTIDGGSTITQYFDAQGRILRETSHGFNGDLIYIDTVYDSFGRVIGKSEPYYVGATIYWNSTYYDFIDRATLIYPADGTPATTLEYDPYTVTRKRTVEGVQRVETETRNVAGQIESVSDPAGTVLNYGYDSQGNLIHTWLPGVANGPEKEIEYDVRGRKISMDDPDMGQWSYQYNGYGELVWQQDAKGQVVTMQYDVLGRVTSRTEAEGTSTWEYGDATTYTSGNRNIGKLIRVTGPDLTGSGNGADEIKTLTYDSLGRLKETQLSLMIAPYIAAQETYITTQTYDQYSRVDTVQYPDVDGARFTVQRNYNSDGYLQSITSPMGAYTYWEGIDANARGQFTIENLGDHITTTRDIRNNSGWIDSIYTTSNAPGVGTVQDDEYSFYENGNIESRSNLITNRVEYFEYDNDNLPLDRLNQSRVEIIGGGTVSTQDVSYDVLGNITYKSDLGYYRYGSQCGTGYGPHAVCEIRSAASGGTLIHSYAYDANGNMTSGAGRTITYTSFNKPTQIQQGGTNVNFYYGAEHSRVFKSASNRQTVYVGLGAEGGALYEQELDSTSGVTEHRHYIYSPDGPIGIYLMTTDSSGVIGYTVNYMHRDHLGSVEVYTDIDGANPYTMSFDAWGQRRNPDWSPNPSGSFATPLNGSNRGFTGHESIAEVGLIHMNGRVYDPLLARFTSADPTIQYEKYQQNHNRYSYVLNNPLSYTDPTGYWSFKKNVLQQIPGSIATVINIVLYDIFPPAAVIFSGMYASANGATSGQIMFSMATSAIGGHLGGKAADYFASNVLQHTLIQGAVSGAFTGYASAKVYGGDISSGILKGALIGAFTAAVTWKVKGWLTGKVVEPDGGNVFSAGPSKKTINAQYIYDPEMRKKIISELEVRLKLKIKASNNFKSDKLKQLYLDRLDVSEFIDKFHVDAGTPALANFDKKTITLFEDFFYREYQPLSGGARRYEPISRMLNRMLSTLLHEFKHLTPYNNSLSTTKSADRALIDAKYHGIAPFEKDANSFSDIIMGKKEGIIDKF